MAPFLWILLTKGSVIIHIFWDNYQIPLFGAVYGYESYSMEKWDFFFFLEDW